VDLIVHVHRSRPPFNVQLTSRCVSYVAPASVQFLSPITSAIRGFNPGINSGVFTTSPSNKPFTRPQPSHHDSSPHLPSIIMSTQSTDPDSLQPATFCIRILSRISTCAGVLKVHSYFLPVNSIDVSYARFSNRAFSQSASCGCYHR